MVKDLSKILSFDDIVFEERNKEYGAYKLRKKYPRSVILGLIIALLVGSTAIITPYLNAVALESSKKKEERRVEI